MIVIADTSALVALSVCDSLQLLVQLFQNVYVPLSVYQECTVANKPQAEKLQSFLKDKIYSKDIKHELELPASLGKGEVDAMILYKILNADILLIYDNRARKVAAINSINVIGSLGVLLLAKKEHLIQQISPVLDKIIASDIYFDSKLISEVKKIARE
jgi:predicted nucleic acid-binding protein